MITWRGGLWSDDVLDLQFATAARRGRSTDGHRYAVIRRRQTYEEMIAGEQFADQWQRPHDESDRATLASMRSDRCSS